MVYQAPHTILRERRLAPHKKFGQNFLVHQHTAERIIELASPDKNDTIIEVGVGFGALTLILASQVHRVIGFEIDSGIVKWHEKEKNLPDNVKLIHADILKTDLAALADESGGLKIIANLPYSISTPFLFKLIDNSSLVKWAVVMLQKEVADRLMAQPGTKEYGVPTVMLASRATVTPLLKVKPEEFHPRPKVDSVVVKITFQPIPARVAALPNFDRRLLRRVVNAAFGQRRKTLLNALHGARIRENKKELGQLIKKAGIPPGIRAEQLTLEDFVDLTRAIKKT